MRRRPALGSIRQASSALRNRIASKPGESVPGELYVSSSDPQVEILERSPARALDFLRAPEFETNGEGPSAGFQTFQEEMNQLREAPDLATKIAGTSWYHTLELPGDIVTPGFFDHRPLVAHYGLPTSLEGQRVLDIATFDGFWAFELERRGGNVTALDVPNSTELDLPPAAREVALREQIGLPMGTGFAIAAEALASNVTRVEGNVYDLNPTDYGLFDFVHLGALLLHLERPLEALRHVRSVTAGILHFSDVYDPDLPPQTARYLGGWSVATWWNPSLDTLCQWVIDAGFDDVKVLKTYRLNSTYSLLPGSDDTTGPWQAIIQARASSQRAS